MLGHFQMGVPSSSTLKNPKVVYNIAGNHTASLTTSNSKGSSPEVTAKTTVKSAPQASIITGDKTICEGDSVQIIAAFTPGASYLWSNGASGSNSIYAKDSGSYYVTVSQGSCSKTSSSIHIGYYPKPSLSLATSLGSVDTVCGSTNFDLLATGVADSFFFYENNVLVSRQTSSTYNTTIDTSTIFQVQSRNANGCLSDMVALQITVVDVLPAPSLSCTVLSQTELRFSWSGAIYHNGFEVSEDSSANWMAPSNGSGSYSHDISGLQAKQEIELWLRAIDDEPCLYSDIAKLSCATDSCSPIAVSIMAEDTVCEGEFVDVKILGLSSLNYGLNFEGNGWTKDTIFSFKPTLSKNYSLLINDSDLAVCPAQEFLIPITLQNLENIELKADPDLLVYCQGDLVSFSVNDSISHVRFIYNGNEMQSGTNLTYQSVVVPNDSLYVISTYGSCVDTSEVLYLNVQPTLNANFTYNRVGPNYTFTPEVNTYNTYLWDFGDGDQSNLVSPTHDYSTSEGEDRDVVLWVTDNNNCTDSAVQQISVPNFASVSSLNKLGLLVYPSPADDELTIENSGDALTVKVYSLNYKLVKEFELIFGKYQIDVSDLNPGVYHLQFVTDVEVASYKMIKN